MTPLEIWDLAVRGRTLFEARDRPDFGQHLAEAALAIREIHPFEAIFAGGGALDAPAIAALRAIGLPLHLAAPLGFPGEAGGLALLTELGAVNGIVVDLGQSAAKLSHREGRARFPRDLTRLPLAGAASRQALLEFVAAPMIAGAAALGSAGPIDTVILALPAELDDDGRPGSSTYEILEGDTALASEALALAGLTGATLVILNDAELAALSAKLVIPAAPTLVLTVGFGVGGAVLRGD